MAVKLSSRQQAQLAYLEGLPVRLRKVNGAIELMANQQADEAVVRGLGRTLDEIKAGASQLSITGLADTAGQMSTIARRQGGAQVKVRGLQELFGSLKINYDAAVKKASVAEPDEEP